MPSLCAIVARSAPQVRKSLQRYFAAYFTAVLTVFSAAVSQIIIRCAFFSVESVFVPERNLPARTANPINVSALLLLSKELLRYPVVVRVRHFAGKGTV